MRQVLCSRDTRGTLCVRSLLLLAFLLASGSVAAQGNDANNDKLVQFAVPDRGAMPLSPAEKRYLAFGQVMYDYYSGDLHSALTQLLVYRKKGLFGKGKSDYALLLMGELFLTLGLPRKASNIFDQLLAKDLLSQTRAQTWFHKGVLHYENGRYAKALRVLESDHLEGLPQHLQARRNLILANLYMYQGQFERAIEYLHKVPDGNIQSVYANYNIGVAMIRSGHEERGIELLRTVMNHPSGGAEINALKDRAALAIGLTALRNENYETARSALARIRLNGPFSNEALLALGMVHFKRGAPRKALPLWLELVQRDPSYRAVQEALLLAPRAYEAVGAMPQALAGYQHAAQVYREELKKVATAIQTVKNTAWLKDLQLKETAQGAKNTKSNLARDYTIEGGPYMVYLYELFSAREFSRRFHQYVQLRRMKDLLARWTRELSAMQEILAIQKNALSNSLQSVRAKLIKARQRQNRLEQRANRLSGSIPLHPDMAHPEDVASYPELIMWNAIQSIKARHPRLSGPLAERLRRVRGLLLWDIAKDADAQRRQQRRQARKLVEMTATTAVRIKALEQLVRDATQRLRGNLAQRLAKQAARLDSLKKRLARVMEDLKGTLKKRALRVLKARRESLINQIAQARFYIASLQDQSVSNSRKDQNGSNGS